MTKKLNDTLKTLSVILWAFFVACSGSSGNDTGKGDNYDDKIITKLPQLPEAIGGMLTEEKYVGMPNREINEENLPEFITVFRAAKGVSEQLTDTPRAQSGKKGNFERSRKEKSARSFLGDFENGSFTIPDRQGGSIIWEWTYEWAETENTEIYELVETGTERYQAFDYSQSENLFFGQVVSLSFYEYWYEDKNGWKETMAKKLNGEIIFRGEFSGSVRYADPYFRETWSSGEYEIWHSGEIIINSGENQIKLSVDDWWDFFGLL